MKIQKNKLVVPFLALLFVASLMVFTQQTAHADTQKLIHGVQTNYQKKGIHGFLGYEDVATQYEAATLDTTLLGEQPYPGMTIGTKINSSKKPLDANFEYGKIIKTTYVKISETGFYFFSATGKSNLVEPGVLATIYVNDTVLDANYGYYRVGQTLKIKVEFTVNTLDGNLELKWNTPSMGINPISGEIPMRSMKLEELYTTLDLNGVDL